MKLVIIIPMYNDWKSVFLLIKKIHDEIEKKGYDYEVLVINDGSSDMPDDRFSLNAFRKQISIKVLNLTCNLGHQRSISIGIAHVHNNYEFTHIVVLDGDGEDKPHGINLLIESCQNSTSKEIIFAEREKRTESKGFLLFYFFYKIIFRILTGKKIMGGNFCIIPKELIAHLLALPEIWNHLHSTIVKSKLNSKSIPVERGKRLDGNSKMNFSELFLHGFSSIAVFSEIVFLRLFFFSILNTLLIAILIITSKLNLWFLFMMSIGITQLQLSFLILNLSKRKQNNQTINNFYKDYILNIS